MKKSRTPTAVTSLVFTLITVFFWASFEVYRALTIKPEAPVPQPVIQPLDPTLDKELLGKLSGRLFFNESEIPNVRATGITPAPTPTTVATPSATPLASQSPVATSSSTINPTATP